jgi:predicted nucleic acid-binding protein
MPWSSPTGSAVSEAPRVCVDTSVFVAAFAESPTDAHRVDDSLWVLQAVERGQHRLVVPASVIAETVGSPAMRPQSRAERERRVRAVERFMNWLTDSRCLIVEIDQLVAERAAWFAQEHELKGGDALVLAAALHANCAVLYTWDDKDLTTLNGRSGLEAVEIVNPLRVLVTEQQTFDFADEGGLGA